MNPALSSPSSKNKRDLPLENFLYSEKMELSNSNVKKLLIIPQEKSFVIFQETETPKKFLIFQETENLKDFLYFKN